MGRKLWAEGKRERSQEIWNDLNVGKCSANAVSILN